MSTSAATARPAPEAAGGRLRLLLLAAAIAAAALAAYADSFRGPFFFDDLPAITENDSIQHLERIGAVLSPPSADGRAVAGRPVVNLSFALNWALSGADPWSYHAANLAIHVLAGLALFGLVRRTLARIGLPRPELAAFAAALLWVLHPLQTESVTAVVQRTESLMGLFFLLTFYCFARAADEPAPLRWHLLSWICCLLGMATKEVMVTAPVLVLLYDRTFIAGSFREAWRRRARVHLSLAATWILLAALLVHGGGTRGGAAGFGLNISPWVYALTQCRAIVLYLRLAFYPSPLIVDYGTATVRRLAAVWPQALLLAALLAATAWALVRRPRWGFLGAWFFVILSPSSSFVPLITQTIAEHRMYLPLAAVAVGAVVLLQRLAGTRSLAIFLLLAAALGAGTARRNRDYRSAVAIWADTAAKLPDNPGARNNLGNALADAGRPEEARAQYEAALRIDPRNAQAHYNLGNLLLAEGRPEPAIAHYAQTARLDPTFTRLHGNFGVALLRAGRVQEAVQQLIAAVEQDPGRAEAHYNLAGALVQAGDLSDAVREFRAAVKLRPDFADARYNLALTLERVGLGSEAAEEYRQVLRLTPNDAEARSRLARLEAGP
ncbi:MAG TPA: tetratricopeptide repeat protein [Opitutaceae bacterium]|nr:tetratricopeptide repeat protein [Opitutaceae bacterium]